MVVAGNAGSAGVTLGVRERARGGGLSREVSLPQPAVAPARAPVLQWRNGRSRGTRRGRPGKPTGGDWKVGPEASSQIAADIGVPAMGETPTSVHEVLTATGSSL